MNAGMLLHVLYRTLTLSHRRSQANCRMTNGYCSRFSNVILSSSGFSLCLLLFFPFGAVVSSSAFFTVIDLFVLLIVFRASSESISESLEDPTPLLFAMPWHPDFHSNKPGWIFSPTATSGHSTCTNKIKHTSITAGSFFAPLPCLHLPLASTTAAKRERIPMAHLAGTRPRI